MLRVNQLIGFGARREPEGGGGFGAHRYWRVYIYSNARNNGEGSMVELEMREAISGSDVTAGATATDDAASGSAPNAIDNTSARWGLGSSFPHWLKVDFGAANDKAIVEIAITTRSDFPDEGPRDFSLQYSDDDSSWTTAFSIWGVDDWTSGETRAFSTPAVSTALYVYPGILDAHDILGSAMVGWWAADRLTGSNGDAQQFWPDISGNGYYLQQYASGERPTLLTSAQNSLNGLTFTAASGFNYPIPNPALKPLTAGTRYMVYKVANDPPTLSARSGHSRTGTHSFNESMPFTDSVVYPGFITSSLKTAGNPSVAMTSFRIQSDHSASGAFATYLDGGAGGSSGGTSPFFSTGSNTVAPHNCPYLGDAGTTLSGTYLDGVMLEMIVSNANDGTTERQKIEGYLAHKWGLTGNLDSAHPYKSSPP